MNFNELCKLSRWSYKAMAKELDVGYDAIYAWRKGTRQPRSCYITAIAKLVGVTEAVVLEALEQTKREFKGEEQ